MNVDLTWLQSEIPSLQDIATLSSGGQKMVFTAIHAHHGCIVLKLIHPSENVQSIERERLAVDQVKSSRVPKILEYGTMKTQVGLCYWFIEERVYGQTLRKAIQSSALGMSDLLRLGLQMLEALAMAEEAKIVHRDIKPENIIMGLNGDFWLLDFGIARHLGLPALTDVAARWGKFTPGYAPPEQFRNIQTEIDSRADLFALGVTLFEVSNGSNPYWHEAQDELQVLRRVESMLLPPLNRADAPHGFSDFIATLAQRRRDHRPKTAKEALTWLEEIAQSRNT